MSHIEEIVKVYNNDQPIKEAQEFIYTCITTMNTREEIIASFEYRKIPLGIFYHLINISTQEKKELKEEEACDKYAKQFQETEEEVEKAFDDFAIQRHRALCRYARDCNNFRCNFRHQTCRRWLEGKCNNPMYCKFFHPLCMYISRDECKRFRRKCKFRHFLYK